MILGASFVPTPSSGGSAPTAPSITATQGLSLLFTVLVTLAPVIYAALRVTAPEQDTAGAVTWEDRGFVFGFLIAAFLTLWGTLGELLTIYRLFGVTSTALTGIASSVFAWMVPIAIAASLAYGWQSIEAVIQEQVQARNSQAGRKATMTKVLGAIAVPQAEAPLPKWTLF
ncbi:MAG: hypothetical protein JO247_02880 [Chloroflexi bacterium]|nr:hypothetical protein [Chloroflexota bacterium]